MTRIRDAACDAILAALDPLPETAPALIPYRPTADHERDTLPEILRELELVALSLYPAWLPTAEGTESLTVEQIRVLAHAHAESTGQSGQFLADLAEAAATCRPVSKHKLTDTAAGIGYAIGQGHSRPSAVLLVDVPPRLTQRAETQLASALDTLAGLSGMGVWLTGAPLFTVTHHPTVAAPRPTMRGHQGVQPELL